MSKTTVVHVTWDEATRAKREGNYVYIGRGSDWGNDWTHLPLHITKAKYQAATRKDSIDKYEAWLKTQPQLMARLRELKGKVLGCYCKPKACHGDVLARLADELPDL